MTLINSTVSGNAVEGLWGSYARGGGIAGGEGLTLVNCTVAFNQAVTNASGAGLYSAAQGSGAPVIRNCLVGDNKGPSDAHGPDIYGSVQSRDFNLIKNPNGFDLLNPGAHDIKDEATGLEALANNGGDTETHALRFDSPALNAGSCTDISGVTIGRDQRGVERPQGSHCDIGAYEFPEPSLALDKYVDDSSPEPGQSITYTIVVENSGAAGATGGTISDTLPSGLGLAGAIILEPPSAGITHTMPTLVTDLTVASGERITVTLPVSVSRSLPTPSVLTNVAAVTSSEIPAPQTGSRAIIVTRGLCPRVYLPMMVRAF